MLFLLITILLNVILSALFKVFPKYNIDALQAIVINYCVCVVTGCCFIGQIPATNVIITQPWLPWALVMGVGFISIFNLIAYCTKVDGITTTTISNKLSLVIPVIAAVVLTGEKLTVFKCTGILLAFPAVFLTTRTSGGNEKNQGLLLPILLFIGSGLLDTAMNMVQHNYLSTALAQATYAICCFTIAGIIGITLITVLIITGKTRLHWKNVVAGICVGIPNYFSIYFLIRALNSPVFQSSTTIPVLNIGILVASTLTAFVIFREKINRFRIIGLILSVLAIVLIALGDK